MKRFIYLLAVTALVFAGCQQAELEELDTATEPDEAAELDTDNNGVSIGVEVGGVEESGPISQTFESENGTFSYTLTWHPAVLTLVDEQYEGATENAPSFDIVGGGHVSVATGMRDAPGVSTADFVNRMFYSGSGLDWPTDDDGIDFEIGDGGHDNFTTYFDLPYDMSPGCIIRYAVSGTVNEGLVFRMEDCDGNDMKAGEAFGDLVTDVVIEMHE
jgi:hypothetical protein